MNTIDFIKKAKEKYGELYDYSKVDYKNNKTKIIIICNIHGEFLQTSTNHLRSKGCPKCSYINKNNACKDTKTFIEKAKQIQKEVYDYTKVNYISYRKHVIIICKIHGEFIQTPDSHLQGSRCTKCSKEYVSNLYRLSNDKFIDKAKLIHNNKYDYSKVNYKCLNKNVLIICKIHGEFMQSPYNHLKGSECSKCAHKNSSSISKEWLNMLKIRIPHLRTSDDIRGEYNIPGTKYFADGYDEQTNTIYEFNGDYWHGNPKIYNQNDINKTKKCTFGELYNNTRIKRKICESLNYRYIEIWENSWKILKRVI